MQHQSPIEIIISVGCKSPPQNGKTEYPMENQMNTNGQQLHQTSPNYTSQSIISEEEEEIKSKQFQDFIEKSSTEKISFKNANKNFFSLFVQHMINSHSGKEFLIFEQQENQKYFEVQKQENGENQQGEQGKNDQNKFKLIELLLYLKEINNNSYCLKHLRALFYIFDEKKIDQLDNKDIQLHQECYKSFWKHNRFEELNELKQFFYNNAVEYIKEEKNKSEQWLEQYKQKQQKKQQQQQQHQQNNYIEGELLHKKIKKSSQKQRQKQKLPKKPKLLPQQYDKLLSGISQMAKGIYKKRF